MWLAVVRPCSNCTYIYSFWLYCLLLGFDTIVGPEYRIRMERLTSSASFFWFCMAKYSQGSTSLWRSTHSGVQLCLSMPCTILKDGSSPMPEAYRAPTKGLATHESLIHVAFPLVGALRREDLRSWDLEDLSPQASSLLRMHEALEYLHGY